MACSPNGARQHLFVFDSTHSDFSDVIVFDKSARVPLIRWYDPSTKKYGDSWHGDCCSRQGTVLLVEAVRFDGSRVHLGSCETNGSKYHGINIVIGRNLSYFITCTEDIY